MRRFVDELNNAIKKMGEIDHSPKMAIIPMSLVFDICHRLSNVESEIEQAVREAFEEMLDEILSIREHALKKRNHEFKTTSDENGNIISSMVVDLESHFCEYAIGFLLKHAQEQGIKLGGSYEKLF